MIGAVLTLAVFVVSAGPACADPSAAAPGAGTPAFVWGYNNRGGLSIGTVARSTFPTPVLLPAETRRVSAGLAFTVAVTGRGQGFAWGDGTFGQLGNGSTRNQTSPVKIKMPAGVRLALVAAGRDHVLAITTDGRLYSWGRNRFGQLGDGTRTDRLRPVHIPTPAAKIVAVAGGLDHSLAVASDGTVLAWGRNNRGQTGPGSSADWLRPRRIVLPGAAKAATVSAGDSHSVALTRTGTVFTWGRPTGTAAVSDRHRGPAPTRVTLPGRVVAVDAGTGHTLALTTTGLVYAWGDNTHHQLGTGTGSDSRSPAKVPRLSKIRTLSTAGDHTIAVDTTGRIWVWGNNRYGQYGNRSTASSTRPARLEPLHGAEIRSIATGTDHSIVLVTRGPLASISIQPRTATVRANQHQRYTVNGYDVFGHSLGDRTASATLFTTQGSCDRNVCWSATTGPHTITANVSGKHATARLRVTAGDAPTPAPTPTSTTTATPIPAPTANPEPPTTRTPSPAAASAGPHGPLGGLASTGAPAGLALLALFAVTAVIGGSLMLIKKHTRRSIPTAPPRP